MKVPSYMPMLTLAAASAKNDYAGLASGLVNTTYRICSALGLAIIKF
jgi:hypothetical protein